MVEDTWNNKRGISIEEFDNRFWGDPFIKENWKINFHNLEDEDFLWMKDEYNAKYLQTFDLPLPVAFFAFKTSIGYDKTYSFDTLNDFLEKDKYF